MAAYFTKRTVTRRTFIFRGRLWRICWRDSVCTRRSQSRCQPERKIEVLPDTIPRPARSSASFFGLRGVERRRNIVKRPNTAPNRAGSNEPSKDASVQRLYLPPREHESSECLSFAFTAGQQRSWPYGRSQCF